MEDGSHLAYATAGGIGCGGHRLRLARSRRAADRARPISLVLRRTSTSSSACSRPWIARVIELGGTRRARREVCNACRRDGHHAAPRGVANLEIYAGPQEFNRLVAMGREFETRILRRLAAKAWCNRSRRW